MSTFSNWVKLFSRSTKDTWAPESKMINPSLSPILPKIEKSGSFPPIWLFTKIGRKILVDFEFDLQETAFGFSDCFNWRFHRRVWSLHRSLLTLEHQEEPNRFELLDWKLDVALCDTVLLCGLFCCRNCTWVFGSGLDMY